MKYFKIEVDEEIYKYLKGKAEPFVDTPNEVLRRELLKQKNGTKESKNLGRFPELPSGIPAALQQVLEVTYLIKQKGILRPEATKIVASRHNIAPQTVIDKYCRQLDKKAYEIDKLLEEKDLSGFKKILEGKFSDHKSVTEKLINELINNTSKKSKRNRDKIGKSYISLKILEKRGDELINTKPKSLLINENEYRINSWKDFDKAVVNWTINNGYLDISVLPIHASNSTDRYFLNTEPLNPDKESWDKIQDGIYMNSKYNAPRLLKNVLKLINHLSIQEKCNIKLTLK